jgi:lipopolysaccharide/colanic/teichoic acid biosynthesis glycosyltransferase
MARLTKIVIDKSLSLILLVILSPLIILLSFVIYITSGRPIFYEWNVVGENGKHFTAYKFRTMINGADSIKAKLENDNEMTGPVFKMTSDPRITPLGKILRKYSLDEIPQLWSVIKGDMSIVGPRPPLVHEYEQFNNWQKQKLAIKPGITCLWQVSGRNNVSAFDEWVKLDLEYIENQSIKLDLIIILKTIYVVFKGTGK